MSITRYSCQILIKLNFLDKFSENTVSNFMKIHQVAAELFHGYRRTDSNNEANSRFSQQRA